MVVNSFHYDGKIITAEVSFKTMYKDNNQLKEITIVCHVKVPAMTRYSIKHSRDIVEIQSYQDFDKCLSNNLSDAELNSVFQQLNNHGLDYLPKESIKVTE